jgi:hypothetical protein
MLYHLSAAADGRTVTHAIDNTHVYNSYGAVAFATVTVVVVYGAVRVSLRARKHLSVTVYHVVRVIQVIVWLLAMVHYRPHV